MENRDGSLNKEDYVEPRCVLCGEPYGAEPGMRTVPQMRIREQLDEYMSRRDYAGAERHLLYWLEEAQLGHDLRGELMIRGELVGHFRKTGNREQAFANAEAVLRLIEEMDFGDTVSAGTEYVNVATAYSAFGENARALELFEKAKEADEGRGGASPELLGGLYNNMALACVALERWNEAFALYDRAMEQMDRVENGALEQAITCLNMANAVEAHEGMEQGESRIFALLDWAQELLDTPSVPRDGYYAFVCEKCAPTFEYYGHFLAAQDLKERAERIYGR